jgi:hypothetical protein
MKELEEKQKTKLEISVKQQKQIEHELIGKLHPKSGHKIFKINIETLEVDEAKYSNATYHLSAENKKEIIIEKGFQYVCALNKKNALKHYNKNSNGSRNVSEEGISFF